MQSEGPTTTTRTAGVRRITRTAAAWLSARRPLVGAGVAVALAAATGLAGCERGRRSVVAADDGAEMARAEQTVDSLARRASMEESSARPLLDDAGLIALGYVARGELGVGSPFRVAALAMRDTRLPVSLGRAVAWAVLARAARGTTHEPAATPLPLAPGGPPVARQLALVDSVVGSAPDARTGESAVRIAYALAAAEGLVGSPTVGAAVQLAAQVRDRRLAHEDAARLLRASAGDREADALALLVRWRAARRFLVEQPLLGDALRANDAAATRSGIALRDLLRDAADAAARVALADTARDSASTTTEIVPATRIAALLPPRAARRLAELSSVRGAPPQAPVAVAAAGYRRQLARRDSGAAGGGGAPDVARRRFAERARSEETLVAEVAVASQIAGGLPVDVAGVTVAASVAMRAFAQDTLSPLAADGPTPEVLHARFGLRAVTFDAGVPAAWRPYYLAQLAGAMDDLRAVLPWIDFDGLAVRVGESVKRDSALALHDPAARTLYLPAGTGAGTIAHELAHDLDWQTASTRLAVRGTYSTDRAMREGTGTLAASMRGLAAARPRSGRGGDPRVERPAELFARGVDWFVANAMAASGRMNGALSAVQDETLAGYAGVVPPDAGDGGADALIAALADMTVVPAAARARFLDRYGLEGVPAPPTLVRLATSVTPRGGAERTLRTFGLLGGACVDAEPAVTGATWRSALLRAAAESRARGALRARGRRWSMPARWSWEARATLGGPWSPAVADTAVARGRDAVLRAVAWEDDAHHPFAIGPVAALASTAGCR